MVVVETGSPRGKAARPVELNQGHRERALAPFPGQVCRDPSAGIRGAPQIKSCSPAARELEGCPVRRRRGTSQKPWWPVSIKRRRSPRRLSRRVRGNRAAAELSRTSLQVIEGPWSLLRGCPQPSPRGLAAATTAEMPLPALSS